MGEELSIRTPILRPIPCGDGLTGAKLLRSRPGWAKTSVTHQIGCSNLSGNRSWPGIGGGMKMLVWCLHQVYSASGKIVDYASNASCEDDRDATAMRKGP